jgi:gamma-glutamylcysteine synthetase
MIASKNKTTNKQRSTIQEIFKIYGLIIVGLGYKQKYQRQEKTVC